MENDLSATDRISKGPQRSIALEYPIISYIRSQRLTWLVEFELLLNHFAKVLILRGILSIERYFSFKAVGRGQGLGTIIPDFMPKTEIQPSRAEKRHIS